MIHKNFKENWLKIIKLNSNVNLIKDFDNFNEIVRIPLTPLEVKFKILYYLFDILYSKFINDQQNVVDLIITKDNKILGTYLYLTKKAGVFEKIEILPVDYLKIKQKHFNTIEKLFNRIQSSLLKKKNMTIYSLRLFKKEGIDLINNYSKNIELYSFSEFIEKFLDVLQELFERELFYFYPEPNVYRFLKEVFNLFEGIKLSKIFHKLESLIPDFSEFFILNSNKLILTTEIRKKLSKSNKSDLYLKLDTYDNNKTQDLDLLLKDVKKQSKIENLIYLNQNDIISFFSELFNLQFPINKSNLKLFLQKILFEFRSFDVRWKIIPKPTIYKTLVRFLIRILGFNVNLKKVSHWAIPELIFNFIDTYFGLNSKILVLITNIKKTKKRKKSTFFNLNKILDNAILFEIENSSIIKIINVKDDNIFSITTNSMEVIRTELSHKYGYISRIVIIDNYLLKQLLEKLVFNFPQFSPFKKLKALKLFKKEEYFSIYPEIEPYQLLKSKSIISFLKILLPILIDKHEF